MKKSTIAITIGFVFLWNSGFIGAEYGLPYAPPFTLLFWRYGALTLVLAAYLVLQGRLQWRGLRAVGSAAIVGILAHGVWLSCVLLALNNEVPAGIVALVVALQPLATGALSGIVTGEVTPLRRWIGLITGFVGVALPVVVRINPADTGSLFGYLVPFGAPVAMTAANLLQRRLEVNRSTRRMPVDLTLFYQSLATTLALALPAIFGEGLATQWTAPFFYTMLWLIFCVSLGAYALMWMLLARIDATRVASLFYLGPPVTMLMAWIAFGDTLQPIDVGGLAIVALAVFLTQLPLKQRKVPANNH